MLAGITAPDAVKEDALGPLPLGSNNSTFVCARMPMSSDRSIFDWGELILPRVDACWDQHIFVNPHRTTSTAISESRFFFKVLLTSN